MRSSILVLAAVTALATARNCTPGLLYCGRTLDAIGNYQPQIDQSLRDAGQPEADDGGDDLFNCIGGTNGVIAWIKYCANGCVDGGAGKDDYCN